MKKHKSLMSLSAALILCGSLSALQALGVVNGSVEINGGANHSASASVSADNSSSQGVSVEVNHGENWDWVDKDHNHYFGADFHYDEGDKVAQWPYAHDAEVSPAYTDEAYRDWNGVRKVHAHAVAIQFNPDKSGDIRVDHFWIKDQNGRTVDVAWANDNLNDREYAIVPKERLDWGSEYSVDFAYHEDGAAKSEHWTFRTEKLNHPLYDIENRTQVHDVARGSTYAFYDKHSDATVDAQFYHDGGFRVDKTVDHDTFYVDVEANVGANVDATVNGEKHHFHVFTEEVKDLEFTNVGDNSVTLKWHHNNSGEEKGYKVYRDDKLVARVSADTTVYTDRSVKPGVHYRYTVKVTNDS